MVQAYRKRLEGLKEEALHKLRTQARQGELGDIRRAEGRVSMLEEILKDFEEEQTDE
jgi:hypothetical protein